MEVIMAKFTVSNKRLKMSPGGVIDIPVAGRKALGMEKGVGAKVSVTVDDGGVVIKPAQDEDNAWRISPKGVMVLRERAYETLEAAPGRHYELDVDDDAGQVWLAPFAS
jgi:bifunctional DNA-binding transcriptional regulator/antitoxin component of YhaV-PrlF toxin-antitoxin module